MNVDWEAYDPSWVAELAREQHPDEPPLAEALSACTRARWESRAYVYFVDSRRPNQPGSEWQFDRNVTLQDPKRGRIVVDLLKDGRVGGLEFKSELTP